MKFLYHELQKLYFIITLRVILKYITLIFPVKRQNFLSLFHQLSNYLVPLKLKIKNLVVFYNYSRITRSSSSYLILVARNFVPEFLKFIVIELLLGNYTKLKSRDQRRRSDRLAGGEFV